MVRKMSALLLSLALLPAVVFAQNQSSQKPTDAHILAQVNHTIANEQAFKGMTIIPSVSNGVVTLSGTVKNYAAKVLASYEISNIQGVRTVLNNLNINSSYTAPPAQPSEQQSPQQNPQPPPQEYQPQGQQPSGYQQNSRQETPSQQYTGPSVTSTKTVVLPSGTLLPVRLSEEINTANAQPNQVFHATLVNNVNYDNYMLIPRGTVFLGRVISAKSAGRFAGYPELSIELTGFTIDGPDGPQKVSVITEPISSQGPKGRGKNTAEKAGGVAALGAIIGAVAGGGKGAAIGALSGGAVGAGMNIKRGKQIDLKPEQLLQFRTSDTTVETVYLHNGQQIPPTPSTTPVLLQSPQQPPSN